jgi:branched-chain amino acid transport system permease protein
MTQQLLDVVIPGLVVGCLYGLIGMAFAVVYKSTRVVNFALGEMMMLVAYTSFAIQSRFALGLAPLIVVTVLVSAVVGAAAEILVIRPLQGEPLFTLVMSTIGLAIVIRSVVAMVWGALPQPIDLGTSSTFHNILGVGLTEAQLAVVAVFLLSCVGMTLFFRFTRMGLFMRATAGDERTAQLIGIDVRRIHAIAWVCSTIISGLAGVLIAMIYNLGPDLYANGLKGFPATILGGLDSVLGSAMGGVVIGIAENLTGRFLGSTAKEVIGLIIIVAVLMIRPYGLFGERKIERP